MPFAQIFMIEGRTGIWRPSTLDTKRNARFGLRRSAKPNKESGSICVASTVTSRRPRISCTLSAFVTALLSMKQIPRLA